MSEGVYEFLMIFFLVGALIWSVFVVSSKSIFRTAIALFALYIFLAFLVTLAGLTYFGISLGFAAVFMALVLVAFENSMEGVHHISRGDVGEGSHVWIARIRFLFGFLVGMVLTGITYFSGLFSDAGSGGDAWLGRPTLPYLDFGLLLAKENVVGFEILALFGFSVLIMGAVLLKRKEGNP